MARNKSKTRRNIVVEPFFRAKKIRLGYAAEDNHLNCLTMKREFFEGKRRQFIE